MGIKDETKMKELDSMMDGFAVEPQPESNLIAILHKAQEMFGYLDRSVMDRVAEKMNIPTAHIWGVATFYHYFNLKPRGLHLVSVCLGTACYIKGAEDVLAAIKKELGVAVGETTADKIFTLGEARCLGACGLAPVMMIDDKIFGSLTAKSAVEVIRKYKAAAAKAAPAES